jgi:transcriptional regulator with XRE-family HTH domain
MKKNEIAIAIGKKLKILRIKKDIKVKDICNILDIYEGTVRKWESGYNTIPLTKLYKICKEYDVDFNYFWPEQTDDR